MGNVPESQAESLLLGGVVGIGEYIELGSYNDYGYWLEIALLPVLMVLPLGL